MGDNTEIESRFTELVVFIRVTIGEHEMPITRETLIEDDLGVSGDDADNLIMAYGKKYNVDITNFKFGEYFLSEPGIFDFIGNRKVKPFAVGYLEKAIIAGRLDEEVINS